MEMLMQICSFFCVLYVFLRHTGVALPKVSSVNKQTIDIYISSFRLTKAVWITYAYVSKLLL